MDRSQSTDLPQELAGVAELLHSHREELSPLDLDRIKLAGRARAVGQPRIRIRREERIVMRTRIIGMLVAGSVMSGTGVATGVSGLASDGNAGQVQYPTSTVPTVSIQPSDTTGSGGPQTLGGTTQSGPGTAVGPVVAGAHANSGPGQSVAGANATSPAAVAQPSRQVSAGNSGESL